MKKITIVLAVLMLAAPAMAVVTITTTQSGPAEFDITAETSGEGTLPRAFALDIAVDSGQMITGISNYFVGEGSGYGIFPASFNRYIDADDPCWGEPNYTPVADKNDLPGDTQPGLGYDGITIEMGSLYKGANSPPNPATLCTISVSGSCTLSLALNIGRGKIIMEDGNEPNSVTLNGTAVVVCIVPDLVGMCGDVCPLIIAAGFGCNIIYDCNDTVAAGCVISQSPPPGSNPGCGSEVSIVVSTGPCYCFGDVDGDGYVAFSDVDRLVNLLMDCGWLGWIGGPCGDPVNDVDGDTFVAFSDVDYLVNYLIANGWFVICP